MTKWLARLFAGVMLLAAISVGSAGLQMREPEKVIPGVLICLGIAAWLWHKSGAPDRRRVALQAAQERWAHEITALMARVNEERAFPVVEGCRALSTPERPVLQASVAKLYELKTERGRAYVGTRVKIGGVPFMLGQSRAVPETKLQPTAEGELALTPDELRFVSPMKSVDLKLARMSSIELYTDGFAITATGRSKPLTFTVDNPLMWVQLLKNLQSLKLDGRKLPDGAMLTIQ